MVESFSLPPFLSSVGTFPAFLSSLLPFSAGLLSLEGLKEETNQQNKYNIIYNSILIFLTVTLNFLTISSCAGRVSSRTAVHSFSICSRICFWCDWAHFLTKSDLPQHLQELRLINAGGEPSSNISQSLPV